MGLAIEGLNLGVLEVADPRGVSDCAVAILERYVGTVEGAVVDVIRVYIDK